MPDDPAELTPAERRRELVQILAAGVLRLRCQRRSASQPKQPPPEVADRLEVPLKTVLSVTRVSDPRVPNTRSTTC